MSRRRRARISVSGAAGRGIRRAAITEAGIGGSGAISGSTSRQALCGAALHSALTLELAARLLALRTGSTRCRSGGTGRGPGGRTGRRTALAASPGHRQTQEQERCGKNRRTHSFRVRSPVHNSFSLLLAPNSKQLSRRYRYWKEIPSDPTTERCCPESADRGPRQPDPGAGQVCSRR